MKKKQENKKNFEKEIAKKRLKELQSEKKDLEDKLYGEAFQAQFKIAEEYKSKHLQLPDEIRKIYVEKSLLVDRINIKEGEIMTEKNKIKKQERQRKKKIKKEEKQKRKKIGKIINFIKEIILWLISILSKRIKP